MVMNYIPSLQLYTELLNELHQPPFIPELQDALDSWREEMAKLSRSSLIDLLISPQARLVTPRCAHQQNSSTLHAVCSKALHCYRAVAMALEVLPGLESSAVSVLSRAVQLDHSSRFQEALVCYQEGIQLLLDALREGKYHEQIKIADSSTGFSYESLFRPYTRDGLTEVWVEDPYIRHVHQLYNFLRFCEMLLKSPCKDISTNQSTALAEIKQSLQAQNICLDIEFSATIHDREIRYLIDFFCLAGYLQIW
ncbi:hypothetical protein DNTS_009918 [Danionella cerebrum]|uniref:MIT domain-containing protein n=1 Tax=Danionella cerebrum TaxID=2873325 RepID=A0A553PV28_9TELE|nr:hypothetical protein DNTS_009918 [Danionella translucida]